MSDEGAATASIDRLLREKIQAVARFLVGFRTLFAAEVLMESSPRLPEIPGYEILEHLDDGGMASVWLARSSQTNQMCVIKSLRPDRLDDRTVRSRFKREAAVTTKLTHPRIARTLEAGETSDGPFIAMEYVAGCDLRSFASRWSDGRVPVDIAVGIALQVLEALDYVHRQCEALPIVHRDLSPANIMIDFDGRVKLIDFGVVRAAVGSFRTTPGMIAGTVPYMSPEQARAGDLDGRSDLYTTAAVIYELLTGQRLADGEGVSEILYSVSVDQPRRPSVVNSAIPESIDAVLLRALEKDPDARYQSAADFAEALWRAVGDVAEPEAIASIARALFPRRYEASCERTFEVADTVRLEPDYMRKVLEVPEGPTAVETLPDRAAPKAARTWLLELTMFIAVLLMICLALD